MNINSIKMKKKKHFYFQGKTFNNKCGNNACGYVLSTRIYNKWLVIVADPNSGPL